MSEQKPKIFLSYARDDFEIVHKVYSDLKRYGLDIWLDKKSILGGQNWKVEVTKAIRKSNYFLAILSKNSVSHEGYVQKELRIALEMLELRSESKIFIIPVRIEECEPDYEKLYDINWIDLYPENEYQNGLKKILQVVSPETFLLRSKPIELSENDIWEMIKRYDFYDRNRNRLSKGFFNKYKELTIKSDRVILDEFSNLMWQLSGSSKKMKFEDTKNCINEINNNRVAGFNDWRLPTLEEGMSLMEPDKINDDLYIDPIFDSKQEYIWTADQAIVEFDAAWVVNFSHGRCNWDYFNSNQYVRAVRSWIF